MANTIWYNDFLGLAYRYYDLRMNIVPLFKTRKIAADMWRNTIHWWGNAMIKVRFVEDVDNKYWFIMGGESKREESNKSFFKMLNQSDYYTRFKKGNDGEAYLRFGTYAVKQLDQVKGDAFCECTHEADDHDDQNNNRECLHDECKCTEFKTFEVTLLKKKKTITDIKFLTIDKVKDDSLSWNCLHVNKKNL